MLSTLLLFQFFGLLFAIGFMLLVPPIGVATKAKKGQEAAAVTESVQPEI